MWIPNIKSIFFGQELPVNEEKKILVLKKLISKFDFEKQYTSLEVQHILRESNVINIKKFKDALIEYDFLQRDLYLLNNFVRNK